MTEYYSKGPEVRKGLNIILANFFTTQTDKCEVCGKTAIGVIKGTKVCSVKCAKELVFDDFEKLVDMLE